MLPARARVSEAVSFLRRSCYGRGMPDRILQFFKYDHLPEQLQLVSRPFCDLAREVELTIPPNPERTVALRKLLEAKDAAVRAILYKEPEAS